MHSIGKSILEDRNFPEEQDVNIRLHREDVLKGNLGITLSSFEDIYSMTPKGSPFPVGCINFEDGKKRFVISWVDKFSSLNIREIEEYSIKLRNYPVNGYPVLSLMLAIHSGKVDPDSNKELWFYGENYMNPSFLLTRIKLYQLINSDEILFCLFDEKPENLDSYGFSLNKEELKLIKLEVESALLLTDSLDLSSHIRDFSNGVKIVENSFNHNGLPKEREALNIYLKRKELSPKAHIHNWGDFTSI